MDIGTINRQALDLWNFPSYTELTLDSQIECANRRIQEVFLELDLTPEASFLAAKSTVFTFASSTAREKTLSSDAPNCSRVLRVESRAVTSNNEDDWEEERRSSYENWDDTVRRTDGNFCAIYGLPPALTLVVSRDVSALEFRVIYQTMQGREDSTTKTLILPPIFETFFVYDIALEFGEMIDNRSDDFRKKKAEKMAYLLQRRQDAWKKIEKWRRSQKGLSTTTRRPFNDRGGIIRGTRKFTVRW